MEQETDKREVELEIPMTVHLTKTVTTTCESEDDVREKIRNFQRLLELDIFRSNTLNSNLEVADVDTDYSFALELNKSSIKKFEE